MRFTRRRLLGSLASLVLACASGAVSAQDFPSRPVELVIPQAPGSGADMVGRLLAEFMTRDLGQPVVVQNKPGANGIIASQLVQGKPADGYTVLLTSVSLVSFNQFLYKNVPYDPLKDFTFVAPVTDAGFVLVASKDSGIKSWDELMERAKAGPGDLTFSSAGLGNSTHLYMEMIALRSGIELRHIPYKSSGPALLAVASGETDLMTVTTATGLAQIKAGKVIGLAQSGEERSPQLPDLPLLKEVSPDVPALPGWYALVGPQNLDPKATQVLADSVNRFLTDPEMKQKLIDQFLFPIPGTPAGIQQRAEEEAEVWGGLIRDLKIQIN
jgi:tripartite-type tricarboxylate transporter receptor subunit TctC